MTNLQIVMPNLRAFILNLVNLSIGAVDQEAVSI